MTKFLLRPQEPGDLFHLRRSLPFSFLKVNRQSWRLSMVYIFLRTVFFL